MNKFNTSLILLLMSFLANAQNLPNIQTASLHAPDDIKIDGKANEWNNQFQAYNKATGVFYTIANDNEKLYLAIHATEKIIIQKIILGGIVLTFNRSGKKDDNDNVNIVYPVTEFNKPALNFDLLNSNGKSNTQIDSSKNELNKQLGLKFKEIGVSGVKGISDNLVSIYNDTGIKAVSNFDDRLTYTYEFAIPLKYLSININQPNKLHYNIRLSGKIPKNATTQLSGSGNFLIVTVGNQLPQSMPVNGQYALEVYPTDFWGEYTLAK